jgi:hypothetical protein
MFSLPLTFDADTNIQTNFFFHMTLPSVEGIRKKSYVLLKVYKNAKERQETISSFAIDFIQ